MSELAIIIPAYKNTFLEKVLISLKNQTNQCFTVYIGIDKSPYDLESIIQQYSNDLKIVTHRFDDNLGGQDLVAQWERCIALSKEENWIWLFSDDDELDPNCVEEFYNTKEKTSANLYRFDTCRIDNESHAYDPPTEHPLLETGYEFILKRLSGESFSFVVEYIFSRQIYDQKNGFINFPLAWASDDATWFKFADNTNIVKIPNAHVYWRYSGINISSMNNNKKINIRKMEACKNYLHFLKKELPVSRDLDLKIVSWYWSQYHFCGDKSLMSYLKEVRFLNSICIVNWKQLLKPGFISIKHNLKKKLKLI